MRAQHGFSLVEMLTVVVVLALVMLLGYPKVRSGMLKNDVRAARTTLINLVSLARTTATQSNRATRLVFNGNSAYVVARPRRIPAVGSNADTIGGVQNLNTSYKVTMTRPNGVDSIRFYPTGLGTGFSTGVTIHVTRSGYSDSVVIDGFGRVKK